MSASNNGTYSTRLKASVSWRASATTDASGYRVTVTTLTSYGWTEESGLSGVITC